MSLCTLVNEAYATGALDVDVSQMLGPLYLGIPASALYVRDHTSRLVIANLA